MVCVRVSRAGRVTSARPVLGINGCLTDIPRATDVRPTLPWRVGLWCSGSTAPETAWNSGPFFFGSWTQL